MKSILLMIILILNAITSTMAEPVSYEFRGGMNMVSFWFATDTIITVLNSYGITLYDYNNLTGTYVRVSEGTTLDRGTSYWADTSVGGEYDFDGNIYSNTTDLLIDLSAGWNMVGNPYSVSIKPSEMSIDGVLLSKIGPYGAYQPPLYYGGVNYDVLESALKPGEGYWIFASSGAQLLFSAPEVESYYVDAGTDRKCILGVYYTNSWNGTENEYTPVNLQCELEGVLFGESNVPVYNWTQVSGASASISTPDQAITEFLPSQPGFYEFMLTVTDGLKVATDTVVIQAVKIPGKIVFTSSLEQNHPGQEVYTMTADGRNLARLTANSIQDKNARWSPDGTRIVFSSDRDGDYEIYVMDETGANLQKMTDNLAHDDKPIWCDVGPLWFISDRDGLFEIYTMSEDGTNQQRVTDINLKNHKLRCSFDNDKLAFSAEYQTDNFEVLVMDITTYAVTRLTNDVLIQPSVSWTTTGKIIYIQKAFWSDDYILYVMNPDGSEIKEWPVPTEVTNIDIPETTENGQYIFYRENDNYIHAMCSDGSCDARIGYQALTIDYHPGP